MGTAKTLGIPSKSSLPQTGYNQNISVRFHREVLDPTAPKKAVNIDYIELRFLYDMNYDNTQVEGHCGDGVIRPWLGEVCDDGNTEDGDYCSADCTIKEDVWCGDFTIQENAGEVCDGDTESYWCSSDCWFKLDKDWDSEASDAGP